MQINGRPYQSIWLVNEDPHEVGIIDQRWLPHEMREATLTTWEEGATAIQEMWVRGAPLIGVTAAFSLWLAARKGDSLEEAAEGLLATRPTAVNLKWAIDRQLSHIEGLEGALIAEALLRGAQEMAEADVRTNRQIGENGLGLIRKVHDRTQEPVQIMTHCNAGWLATVDYGTATAPIYLAHEQGIPMHIWVSETRPRNQGFSITAWEMAAAGIPYTLVVDSACGHIMQSGQVDLVLVGTDRTASNGDVGNKIGTYLKALAALSNNVPFYVCAPTSSIDMSAKSGADIPIEERSPDEVIRAGGEADGKLLAPKNSPVYNPGFDITPAAWVTGLITEKAIVPASIEGIQSLKLD